MVSKGAFSLYPIEQQHINISYYKSPVGELILGSYAEQLCLCDWRYRARRNAVDKRVQTHLRASYHEKETATHQEAVIQLKEYFTQKRKEFDISLHLAGSDFQQKVWKALLDIPFGKTTTYSKLSIQLNNLLAIRAVAAANGANALSIFVPCHRVIGNDGDLVGYAGGLPAKKKLLELEGSHIQQTLF